MDYQEAIDKLQHGTGFQITGKSIKIAEFFEALDVAISAMQELQIYKDNDKRNLSRTDRLMDECTYRHENGNCLRVGGFCTSVPLSHCQRYKDWYTDYRGYKKLGTLEEVRDAVEKQRECKYCGYKTHSDRISELNSCNDCGLKNTCVKRPEYGDYCRINCYDWRKQE